MPIVRVADREFDVDAVVFDKDGTLIDLDASWAPLAESWITAIAAAGSTLLHDLADNLGYDISARRLVPDSTIAAGTLIDVGDATHRLLLDNGYSAGAASEAVGRARAAIELAAANHPAVTLADLAPLFSGLVSGGLGVAVLTSDDRVPTLDFLERNQLTSLVSAVMTSDDVDHPKPHPDGLHRIGSALGIALERMLMVGDSTADHGAARASGAWFVAVGHGSAASIGADATVACVDEIGLA